MTRPAAATNEHADGVGPLALMGLLGDKTSSRMKRAMGFYLTATMSWRAGVSVWGKVRANMTYTISVPADDEIYNDVHSWLLDLVPSRKLRAMTVLTSKARGSDEAVPADSSMSPRRHKMTSLYDGSREQTVAVGAHRVKVRVEKENIRGADGRRTPWSDDKIIFTTYGAAARDAVLAMLNEVATARHGGERHSDFYLAGRWGGWDRRTDLARRELDSVVLKAGQIEGLVEDITAFLAGADEYKRLGIPYHRGFLFHGPPGTGKTSVAQAIATRFDLDIYYAPLSDLERDQSLLQLVSAVRPGSMLLLEDIDVLHAAKSRDDDAGGLTLSGLLNALDGVGTPSGLLTVMTTNHLDVLDDALVRAGRVDRLEEIGELVPEQFLRLVDAMSNGTATPDREPQAVWRSPADVVEVFKRHLGKPQDAIEELWN